MLGNQAIKAYLSDGKIKVLYTFLPTAEDSGNYKCSTENDFVKETDGKMYNHFVQNLNMNNISIRIGGLVYIINNKQRIPRDKRFGNHRDVFDLKKDTNGYNINPQESVIVFSNEYFDFTEDVSGLIISRVGNYVEGIDVHASYIDAGWRGLVKVFITNNSSIPYNIKIGTSIAKLFLFETRDACFDGKCAKNDAKHFELTWKKIYEEPEDQYFNKGNSENTSYLKSLLLKIKTNYQNLIGVSFLTIILIVLIPFFKNIMLLTDALDRTKKNESQIAVLEDQIKNSNISRSLHGTSEIDLSTGSAIDIIKIGKLNSDPIMVLFEENTHNVLFDYSILKNNGEYTLKVFISQGENNKKMTKMEYKWILLL
jgi:deoxycytidine triphosphate deaminase